MERLDELLEDQLKDLFSAENQLVKALPRLAKKATSDALKDAFTTHLEETEGQIERLNQIGELLEMKLSGKKCKAMEGLIEEGKEILEEGGQSAVIDAALIGAAQKVEHYEISAYETAKAIATQLELTDVVALLEQTLEEESQADEKLTAISLDEVLPATASEEAEEDEGAEDEEIEAPARRGKR